MVNKLSSCVRIPANLDLEKLLIQHPFSKPNCQTKDKLALICNIIIHLMEEQKKHLRKQNGYVHVQSKYLKNYISDYHLYVKYLVDCDVLDCNDSYCTRYYSKGYKFIGKYSYGAKSYNINSAKLSGRIEKVFRKLESAGKKRLNKALHLQNWFNNLLVIDKQKATLWIHDSYNANILDIEDANLNEAKYQKIIQVVNEKHQSYTRDLYQFKTRNHSVDKSGFRFHNTFTTMTSELRNFIKYNGQYLSAFDIKTSQPYFSLLLFQPEFYFTRESKNALTLKKLYPELYEALKRYGGLAELKKIAEDLKKSAPSVSDVDSFRKNIIESDFYQIIANFLPGSQSRDIGKSKIYPLLFEDWNHVNYGTPYIKAFKKQYPTVYKVFSILKRRRHNDFAKLLQRIESEVMYRATKSFNTIYPDTPLYTIHDNFITTVSYKQQLYDLVMVELEKWTGNKPKLCPTEWRPENAKMKTEI